MKNKDFQKKNDTLVKKMIGCIEKIIKFDTPKREIKAIQQHMTEMTLINLEVFLPEIRNVLSQTILTCDIIGKICEILTYDVICDISTIWINDIDTTIGMECLWVEFLVQEIPLNPSSSKYLEEALGITDENEFTKIQVKHQQYGKHPIYITIINNSLIMSTKYEILWEYCTGNICY